MYYDLDIAPTFGVYNIIYIHFDHIGIWNNFYNDNNILDISSLLPMMHLAGVAKSNNNNN